MFSTFNTLSEIFGRSFAMGHLLPGTIFLGFSLLLADRYKVLTLQAMLDSLKGNATLATLLGALLLGLWGIALLAVNPGILRLREGYPLRWLRVMTSRQKERLAGLRKDIDARGSDHGRVSGPLRTRLATHFPDNEKLLLPTTFGNIARAFESYPVTMYGFEATRGWTRLLAVMPKEYRELVEGAKAEVDFLVNLWLLSWLFLLEYIAFAVAKGRLEGIWLALGALASLWLSSRWSLDAAVRWGEMVKASFDVYLPELRKHLGFEPPKDRTEERAMWAAFSEAFQTRQADRLPDLAVEPPASEPHWHRSGKR